MKDLEQGRYWRGVKGNFLRIDKMDPEHAQACADLMVAVAPKVQEGFIEGLRKEGGHDNDIETLESEDPVDWIKRCPQYQALAKRAR